MKSLGGTTFAAAVFAAVLVTLYFAATLLFSRPASAGIGDDTGRMARALERIADELRSARTERCAR